MKIQQLEISNFRSINHLVLNPGNLAAIIGPNSSGKTNILKAIDLVIGEGWTTKAKVARELFYDPKRPIEIEIMFSTPVSVPSDNAYPPTDVSSVKLNLTLTPELSARTTINGGNTFYGQEKFKKLCHFIYIPSERNLGSELKVSDWTMLGRLMKLVYGNYIAKFDGEEQQLKKVFADKMQPAKEFLEADFDETTVTYKRFVTTFQKHCKSNSAGLANEFNPILDIYNLNWFYKTLQIHVKEKYPERLFDSDEVGAGMQNLLLISIFQTYSELMGGKVIFGIEEPEIYLYPQAQRSLYKNFISLSSDTQIFYTTHNPNYIDAARPDDILMIRKEQSKGTFVLEKDSQFSSAEADRQKYKIYTHFNPERNELFFARKVLFVEGDSDKILFSTLSELKWKIKVDELGISIISCGGKAGVSYFIGVCKLLGIENYFAVWDKDEELDRPDLLDLTRKANKGLELDPNLENVLKLPDGKDAHKVKNAHEWAQNSSKDQLAIFDQVKVFLGSDVNLPMSELMNKEITNEPEEIF